METAEERRDFTIGLVVEAGGVIRGAVPLAHPDAPHTVVAYRILAGSPTAAVRAAVDAVKAETEIGDAGLVPWAPEPVEEVGEREGSGG